MHSDEFVSLVDRLSTTGMKWAISFLQGDGFTMELTYLGTLELFTMHIFVKSCGVQYMLASTTFRRNELKANGDLIELHHSYSKDSFEVAPYTRHREYISTEPV